MFGLITALTGLAGPLMDVSARILDLVHLRQRALERKSSLEELGSIAVEITEAHERKAIILAEAGNRLAAMATAFMRFMLAIGPTIFLLKILMWDKVIGSFSGCVGRNTPAWCARYTTDPIDANLWYVIFAVIAFYFAYDISARLKK